MKKALYKDEGDSRCSWPQNNSRRQWPHWRPSAQDCSDEKMRVDVSLPRRNVESDILSCGHRSGNARDSYGLVCSGLFKDGAGNESRT